jgi:hypothetical protein
MRLVIRVDCDNEAFNGADCGSELARILRQLANKLDAIQTAMTPAGIWINSFFNENPTTYWAAPAPAARYAWSPIRNRPKTSIRSGAVRRERSLINPIVSYPDRGQSRNYRS